MYRLEAGILQLVEQALNYIGFPATATIVCMMVLLAQPLAVFFTGTGSLLLTLLKEKAKAVRCLKIITITCFALSILSFLVDNSYLFRSTDKTEPRVPLLFALGFVSIVFCLIYTVRILISSPPKHSLNLS